MRVGMMHTPSWSLKCKGGWAHLDIFDSFGSILWVRWPCRRLWRGSAKNAAPSKTVVQIALAPTHDKLGSFVPFMEK